MQNTPHNSEQTETTETIVALATPNARSAIGVIRLSGTDALNITEKLCATLPAPRTAQVRKVRDENGEIIDEVVLTTYPAPNSYTGENSAELAAHGNPVLLEAIIDAACALGARRAAPGEFTQRAFLNNRMDLAQAESVADLIDASSRQAARAAQRSLSGEFSQHVNALLKELISIRVFIEGALDFSDEDVDWLADANLPKRLNNVQSRVQTLLQQAERGVRLNEGITIALAGLPNVGKSTLLNQLSGTDAAIVTDIAGTTRDTLRETFSLNGIPVTLIDTAGLRETQDPVEQIGVARAWAALNQVELIIFVIDARNAQKLDENPLLQKLPQEVPRLILLNKTDLLESAEALMENHLSISALNPADIEKLKNHIYQTISGQFTGPNFSENPKETEKTQKTDGKADIPNTQFGGEATFSARTRHLEALRQVNAHLDIARNALSNYTTAELAAEDLKRAQIALAEITGAFSSDDLLGHIFAGFCIGK